MPRVPEFTDTEGVVHQVPQYDPENGRYLALDINMTTDNIRTGYEAKSQAFWNQLLPYVYQNTMCKQKGEIYTKR